MNLTKPTYSSFRDKMTKQFGVINYNAKQIKPKEPCRKLGIKIDPNLGFQNQLKNVLKTGGCQTINKNCMSSNTPWSKITVVQITEKLTFNFHSFILNFLRKSSIKRIN